jgi:hypothetical protein
MPPIGTAPRLRHTATRRRKIGDEWRGLHVDTEAVGPDRFGIGHDVLEDGGLEVPARGIEAGRVRPQLVEHVLHLVHAGQGFHEHDGADGGVGQPRQPRPAQVEQIAIDPRLGGELELGQVEVNALAALGLRAPGMEERERGPQQRGVDRAAVHGDVGLVQVQAPLAVHEEGQLAGRDPVLPVAGGVAKVQLALHGRHPVVGGRHGIHQPVAARILVVVEIALRALTFRPGVQRVDEHRGNGARTGDLDAGFEEVRRDGRDPPVTGGGTRWVAGQHAARQRRL